MKYIITIISFSYVIMITLANAQSYTYASEGFEAAVWATPATSYAATTGNWTTSASTVVSSPTSPNTTNGGTKCLSIPSGQFLTSPTLNNGAATLTLYARSTSTTARTITILTSSDGTSFTTLTTASSSASSLSYALINIVINNAAVKNIRISYPAGGGGAIDDINISAITSPNYYNAPNSDVTTLNNWWSNIDGATGSHPLNFTTAGQTFDITHTGATMSAAWTVLSISLAGSNTLTLGGNVLKINGAVSGTGTFTGSNASSMIIAGNAGTLNFTPGGQILKDLTLNSNAVATVGTLLNITGGAAFGTVTIANGATLTTGNNLTLKSTIDGTARVGLSAGIITGNVTVERFIPANSTRAWRMLSIPVVTNQTFHSAWQENQATAVIGTNNLGVNITSSRPSWNTDGFDYQTNSDALLSWNGAANNGAGAWVGITSTNNPLANEHGYMLYVRGDRNATPSNNSITATTLRASGTLKQGAYPSTPLTVPASQYSMIGNPYVSQIDFRNITKGAGIDNTFYVWDPKLTGANGLGAFQTMANDGSNYLISPGGGSYGTNGSIMNTIESGEAFFVHATTTGNISFTESSKSSGSNMVFSPTTITEKLVTNLYAVNPGNNILADGTLVLYDNNFSDSVTSEDAGKLSNFGINMSMVREGKALAIEKRKLIGTNDTIFFNTSGLIQHEYLLEIIATNLDHPALFGYLQDNYPGTTTPINLNGSTSFLFSIDANPGSSAANRFRIIFSPIATLSLRLTTVTAYPQNRSIVVSWTTENERDMLYYDVERGPDGSSFSKQATVVAHNANTGSYCSIDLNPIVGENYYRIKSVSANGDIDYSRIVKSFIPALKSAITIHPNPVTDGKINLQLSLPVGVYTIRMFNSSGHNVFSQQLKHDGSSAYTIIPGVSLPKGVYQIQISNASFGSWVKVVY